MNKLKKTLFKQRHKIVPTYSPEFQRNGYVVLEKQMLGWYAMRMLMYDGKGEPRSVPSYFPTYEEAWEFLQYHLTIIEEDEEIPAEERI